MTEQRPILDPSMPTPNLRLCKSCGLWSLFAHGSDVDCVAALRDALSRTRATSKLPTIAEGVEPSQSSDSGI